MQWSVISGKQGVFLVCMGWLKLSSALPNVCIDGDDLKRKQVCNSNKILLNVDIVSVHPTLKKHAVHISQCTCANKTTGDCVLQVELVLIRQQVDWHWQVDKVIFSIGEPVQDRYFDSWECEGLCVMSKEGKYFLWIHSSVASCLAFCDHLLLCTCVLTYTFDLKTKVHHIDT